MNWQVWRLREEMIFNWQRRYHPDRWSLSLAEHLPRDHCSLACFMPLGLFNSVISGENRELNTHHNQLQRWVLYELRPPIYFK